jgi:hypothetical protein
MAGALQKLSQELKLKDAIARRKAAFAKPANQSDSIEELERALFKKAQTSEANAEAPRASRRSGKKHPKTKNKKGQKHKNRRPEDILTNPEDLAAYEQLVLRQQEEFAASLAAQAPKQPAYAAPTNNRAEIFDRIRETIARSTPHVEDRPSKVTAKTRAALNRAIENGALAYAASPKPDRMNGFIVGFDFGTSSLKLAVRQPYKAGRTLAVMPVPPELRSGGHAYLWQTVIWYSPKSQEFSLYPRTGFEPLQGFKTGIIGGKGSEPVRPDLPVTRSQAAVAFIALQVAHFFGWYHHERPLGELGGKGYLAINIGIPVATQDDERAFRDFRHILCAAHELLPLASSLDLSSVRQAYQQSGDKLPDGWDLVPELTAAMAGYAAEPTSKDGCHVLIDVGASTLDIVAFNHVPDERFAVISAAVELLGAASLEASRAAAIPDSDFLTACGHEFDSVFGEACRYSRGGDGFSPERRGQDVQLITTGGGCASSLHAQFIATKNVNKKLGTLPIVHPEPPASCVNKPCDLSRLLLAYGLTRDVQELLDLKLPSQVPSIARPPAQSVTIISKDMV